MTTLDFPSETKIYVNDSLCPYYRGIWGKCRKLLANCDIKYLWTANGNVLIRRGENSQAVSILHDEDLYSEFPDFDFTKNYYNVTNVIT